MNSLEQKNHKTALSEQARLTAEAFEAVAERCDLLRDSIGEERTHRLKLADEQRGYVDARDRELRDWSEKQINELLECVRKDRGYVELRTSELRDTGYETLFRLSEFRRRGFWSRLNWLLTGR